MTVRTSRDLIADFFRLEAQNSRAMVAAPPTEAQVRQAREAFDGIADRYDDGNVLLARMRRTVWRAIEAAVPPGGRLLDLGCGPGIDAVHLAGRGYRVVAVDLSPRMVQVAAQRAAAGAVADRVTVAEGAIHQPEALPPGPFDGLYSNFGALNCVPDLAAAAAGCAARLEAGGPLVVCVMGRHVPWEWLLDRLRGRADRGRGSADPVPVGLEGHTVWTRYYTPRELFSFFAPRFALVTYRGLGLIAPPPHLAGLHRRWRALGPALGWLDDRLAGLPGLREGGDHFVMTLRRR
jgi:SAM-dependent methyltransferase